MFAQFLLTALVEQGSNDWIRIARFRRVPKVTAIEIISEITQASTGLL